MCGLFVFFFRVGGCGMNGFGWKVWVVLGCWILDAGAARVAFAVSVDDRLYPVAVCCWRRPNGGEVEEEKEGYETEDRLI